MSRIATISVPATSANLGPGFDSLGVALELRDVVSVELTDTRGIRVRVSGEGSDRLPTDERHLVAKVVSKALVDLGVEFTGIEITCTNKIPQGRGLGSSAAAVVAGLAGASALANEGDVDLDWVFAQAVAYEGHPDNAAACVYGGLTVAWSAEHPHARSVQILPEIKAILGVPSGELLTEHARGLLPDLVPHVDAAFNSARSALLIIGLTQDSSVLLAATDDRLHQNYRAEAYPDSMAVVSALRSAGVAACISGAGPAVLAFVIHGQDDYATKILANAGFSAHNLPFAERGITVV